MRNERVWASLLRVNTPDDFAYVPWARTFLGQLKNRMSLTNMRQGVWHKTLFDGTEIKVASRYGKDFIFINIEQPEAAISELDELDMESGVLTVDQLEIIAEGSATLPLKIYMGGTLQDYTSTGLPDGGIEYMIPTAKAQGSRYGWEDNEPITSNPYDSIIWADDGEGTIPVIGDTASKSERYTGLARLMVQSVIGAGRSIHEVSPTGIMTDTLGLVRTTDYTYFLIGILPGGVIATEMETDSKFDFIKDWLTEYLAGEGPGSSLSTESALQLESWLLSTITWRVGPGGLPIQYSFLDGGELVPVTGTAFPIANSWHFSYGTKTGPTEGTAQFQAAIVTHVDGPAGSKYWIAGLHRVEFSFEYKEDEDTGIMFWEPSGTLTSDEEDVKWVINGNYDVLFAPVGDSALQWYQPPQSPVPEEGDEAPVYCYFDLEDTLRVLRYTHAAADPDAGKVNTGCSCSPGAFHYEKWTTGSRIGGGWFLDELFTTNIPGLIGNGNMWKYQGSWGFTGGRSNCPDPFISEGSVTECTPSGDPDRQAIQDHPDWPTPTSFCNLIAESSGTFKTVTAGSRSIRRVAFIPNQDPDAIGFFQYSSTSEYGNFGIMKDGPGGCLFSFRLNGGIQHISGDPTHVFGCAVTGDDIDGANCTSSLQQGGTPSDTNIISPCVTDTYTSADPLVTTQIESAELTGANGLVYDLGDDWEAYDDLNFIFPTTTNPATSSPIPASGSFGGDFIYYDPGTDETEFETRYPEIDLALDRYWIGFA